VLEADGEAAMDLRCLALADAELALEPAGLGDLAEHGADGDPLPALDGDVLDDAGDSRLDLQRGHAISRERGDLAKACHLRTLRRELARASVLEHARAR